MTTGNRNLLEKKLAAVGMQLTAKLAEIRASHQHAGVKGAALEEPFRAFLRRFLPRRLEVGHGEVIDTAGRISRQTDVVITNEEHPPVADPGEPSLFFIEGVAAAGEVKTCLDAGKLRGALDAALQFKTLEPFPGVGTIIQMNESDLRRFYERRPFFLFAFDSSINGERIKEVIEEHEASHGVPIERSLDAVFVIDRGWVINFGDGRGTLKFGSPGGPGVPGWVVGESDRTLLDFMSWLSAVMQREHRRESILVRYSGLTVV